MSGTGDRFIGVNTIHGVDGEHATPYMTRAWIGRLRLHIFHRGDADEDCHDHPWCFWTLPFHSYVEEVVEPDTEAEGFAFRTRHQIVKAFRLHYRPATHCHRVLSPVWQISADRASLRERLGRSVYTDSTGKLFAPDNSGTKIVTLVWRTGAARRWGFLKNRDGNWCWVPWKEYVFRGGKHAPCSPDLSMPENRSDQP